MQLRGMQGVNCKTLAPGFRSRSRLEPGNLAGAGAGAVTLAWLLLHLKYLFNNSQKLHGT